MIIFSDSRDPIWVPKTPLKEPRYSRTFFKFSTM